MRGYLTFGHHNACKSFVACMHGSEIICQLPELLCNHLVYGVGKILKDTVRKNFFTSLIEEPGCFCRLVTCCQLLRGSF